MTATKRYLNDSGWANIDTAPINEKVFLLVTDGIGAPYCLARPWKLTPEGWVSSGRCAALKVTPLRPELFPWKKEAN